MAIIHPLQGYAIVPVYTMVIIQSITVVPVTVILLILVYRIVLVIGGGLIIPQILEMKQNTIAVETVRYLLLITLMLLAVVVWMMDTSIGVHIWVYRHVIIHQMYGLTVDVFIGTVMVVVLMLVAHG